MKRAWILTVVLALSLAALWTTSVDAQQLKLPNSKESLHFAVVGDTGTGDRHQYDVGEQLAKFRTVFPFDFVVMMGDNMYGGESPKDFVNKFERPYAALLSQGVKFYASLGNHDNSNQRFYEKFNMNGEKYYTFKPRDGFRFFALDSNYMDKKQVEWLEKELKGSGSEWKIAFFHHPLYSSGEKHGPDEELRSVLEPMFVRYGVSLVLTGHEHFYERLKPQKGINYFIIGNSAKLRKGDLRKSDLTAKGFDTGYAFMLFELDKDKAYFQTISQNGETVDSGMIERPVNTAQAAAGASR